MKWFALAMLLAGPAFAGAQCKQGCRENFGTKCEKACKDHAKQVVAECIKTVCAPSVKRCEAACDHPLPKK